MIRAAVALLVVATIVGAVMPASLPWQGAASTAASAPELLIDASKSDTSQPKAMQLSGGEVSLSRRQDGHFYADVEVNGTSVEFLIDTGASGIAMSEADARRVGVLLESERTYVGEGAGGALSGQIVRLDRVQLGDQVASGVRAVVIEGGSTNLLGQSILARFNEVTVRGDVMTLR